MCFASVMWPLCACRYEDLKKKIPRAVVTQLSERVRACAENLMPGVVVTTCGSYRRGAEFSGDIDILLCHPDGDCPILNELVGRQVKTFNTAACH